MKSVNIVSKVFFYILFSTLLATSLEAAEWEVVGEKGFAKKWSSSSITIDTNNPPYVADIDDSTNQPSVMKYNSTAWSRLDAVSTNSASDIDMAIDSSDNVYVLFGDYTQAYKTTVKKFYKNGSYWETVGNAGFSEGSINSSSTIATAIDGNNIPYAAYRDSSHSNKATVMKFNSADNNWSVVGTAGFSEGGVYNVDIVLDSNNIPYVAYQDEENSNEVTVMKFTGTWGMVGYAGFSNFASYVELAIDSNDVPYVVYGDAFDTVSVMKFDALSWVYVGPEDISTNGMANYASLALDDDDTPYVSFADGSDNYKATVMKFAGANWFNVGTVGFSDGFVVDTDIAISDKSIYVLYDDESVEHNLTAMKFENPVNQTGLNPAIIMYLLN